MKLLVIGGTRFLGRHIAQQALEAGHELTLLHRGRSGPDLFPEARHVIADRNGELDALKAGRWDAAIDTSAYFPRQVHALAAVLADRVDHYQLVSTISVYADSAQTGQDETAPLQTLEDPNVETVTGATYGGLKVLCEQAAEAGFAGRCLINRPGLLVGPHDPTGRFTWWVQRARRGGEMLGPGDPTLPTQFIDARDAAAWMLRQAEQQRVGPPCNLTGPATRTSMGTLLQTACDTLAPAGTHLTWVDEAFLVAQGVKEWMDLPLWLTRPSAALSDVSIARALASGLQCRPMAQTLADTDAWGGAEPSKPNVGLAPEREAAVLAAWHAAHPAA